jgi:hypothetical protein
VVATLAVYLVAIGGDYFEFRFFDAVLPVWGLWTAAGVGWLAGRIARPARARVAASLLAALPLAANLATALRPVAATTLLTTPEQEAGYTRGFAAAGRWLALNLEPDDVIAVRPAGVIPYLARVRAVDMLGLNDREIARRSGALAREGAVGHQRAPSREYLAQRGVTYLIAHPEFSPRPAPPGLGIVSAELRPGLWLLFERLDPHARLEARAYGLGEHRGSLEGWQPVERAEAP